MLLILWSTLLKPTSFKGNGKEKQGFILPPLPVDTFAQASNSEAHRLASLEAYQILDTQKEETFDSIVQLTATVLGAPIAMITFVDKDRTWVKSAVGSEITQVDRDFSFCNSVIKSDLVFEVPNALLCPDFSDHPFVTSTGGLRFYAGAPLTTKDGHRLGVLCIVDTQPRSLSEGDRAVLKALADQVMTRLDLNRRERELELKTRSLVAFSRKLENKQAELDQIAYAVSHELKSPLRAIHNLTEWVSEELHDHSTEETRKNLSLIRNRVRRLDSLFNGLLGYFNASKKNCSPEPVNVHQLVSAQISTLQQAFAFTAHIASDLPVLLTDKSSLETVFFQLIKNAVHHNPLPTLSLEIGWSRRDRHTYVFFVQDNGTGIAAQFQEQVFGIFKTMKNWGEQENTGIGLTMVRKVLQERDQQIWVESKEQQGCRFSFTWAV